MKAKIYPSKCSGQIVIPPSKSMGHRAIICASMAPGRSIIKNTAYSDDIKTTIEGMRKLGAVIEENGSTLIIDGIKDITKISDETINCNESGSTLRFFIPIFSLTGKKITFLGKNRLLKRPQKIYEDIFKEQKLHYYHDESKMEIEGKLKAGTYEIDGNISSQFISGLLFTLPLLEGDSEIKIRPPFESASYIDLTLEMLKRFGIEIFQKDELTFKIRGNQKYSPCDYTIEGDFSQLGFFAVLGAVNNDLKCLGLNHDSKQGDKAVIEILRSSGVNIENIEGGYFIHKSTPKGCEIDLADCPDLGPILNVLGMYGDGDFRIYNAGRLRYKESDRIAAMEEELLKLGVSIKTTEDEIFISGKEIYAGGIEVSGHKDHRIVMSMAVAATLMNKPVIIDGAEAVEKSYPDFFEDIEKIGVKVECYDK
ncbi:3-phosphoshikimate 1-carboxyvinyltransferase [Fusobacterium ulcerans]|uniref:3-phosphoshikimate 1-carboxyvinyltransferase n=1 Tax=Fusobacterium ulcerans TaxID=861 RepID=UPI00267267F9|nr:3-phosphoshikimate 1-carboxyvinyltransferase [Fusobacterium ulcerans]